MCDDFKTNFTLKFSYARVLPGFDEFLVYKKTQSNFFGGGMFLLIYMQENNFFRYFDASRLTEEFSNIWQRRFFIQIFFVETLAVFLTSLMKRISELSLTFGVKMSWSNKKWALLNFSGPLENINKLW